MVWIAAGVSTWLQKIEKFCSFLAIAAFSASAVGGTPAVDARDRIGKGPWRNAKGEVIANNLDELHGTNNLTKQTALTEKGEIVNGRGDTPNLHVVLTGSTPDGRFSLVGADSTCSNWTSGGAGSRRTGSCTP